MKRSCKILAALFLLVTANAHAKTHIIISGTKEKPFSVHAGAQHDSGGYSRPDDHGIGPKSIAGDVGVAHYIGDFEYGLNIFGGWGTGINGKLFSDSGKNDGFKMGANLSSRYMPYVATSIRFGGLVGVGYSRLFGDANKAMNDSFSFGDMSFEIGPAFMHQAFKEFSWGAALSYGMTEMRFGSAKAGAMAKKFSNLHTVRVPFDFVYQATDDLGLAFAIEPGWRYLDGHKFHHGIFGDVVVGVNYRL